MNERDEVTVGRPRGNELALRRGAVALDTDAAGAILKVKTDGRR